jgi:hypothetical protein
MRLSLDVSQLHAAFGNMGTKIDDAIRASAQAGAQVFYNEAQARAPAASGRLQDAIYQKFIPEMSADGVRATYKVSWRTGYGKSADGTALVTAPHGHLLEFGWVQRYQVYYNKRGEFKTMVRPDAKGKKKPGKFASQATKDAYYVLRKGGPVQWLPKSFIRTAYTAKEGAAAEAMKSKLIEQLTK